MTIRTVSTHPLAKLRKFLDAAWMPGSRPGMTHGGDQLFTPHNSR